VLVEMPVKRRNKSLEITGWGSDYRGLRVSMCRMARPKRRWHDDEQRKWLHVDATVPRLAR
jgi:hypothetical protein